MNAGGGFSAIAFDKVKQFAAGRLDPGNGLTHRDLARHPGGQSTFREIVNNGANGKTGDKQLVQSNDTARFQISPGFRHSADGEVLIGSVGRFHAHIAYQSGSTGGGAQQAKFFGFSEGNRTY